MLRFAPKTEEEVLNLLSPGTYEFYVRKAEFTVSRKTNNPMIKLNLGVIDANGKDHYLTDYLMESMLFKVKHFCDAVGLEDAYNNGSLVPEMCEGKSGQVKIIIQQPEEDSPFNPQNAVKDYVKRVKSMDEVKKDPDFIDDDLPDLS